ncbi:hypothetical protein PENTCL1PPCAC_26097, partial [Pristionchus entomophagus]
MINCLRRNGSTKLLASNTTGKSPNSGMICTDNYAKRSTHLTAAFIAYNQRLVERMYALMSSMQKAVLSD